MAKNNPINPESRDENRTKADIPRGLTKARVLSTPSHPDELGYHTVTVQVYNSGEVFDANVLMPMAGCVWVPSEGNDVQVLFNEGGSPWVIGSWYAKNRVQDGDVELFDYEDGTIRLGNETGSRIEVRPNGDIELITTGNRPVGIDVQSASVQSSTPQTISGDDVWEKVAWDVVEDDQDNLFQSADNSLLARFGGLYHIHGSVSWPNPKQSNKYEIGIFVNDVLQKYTVRQSANNIEMTTQVHTDELLESGDVIDIRVRQDSGSGKDTNGSEVTDEFTVNRTGRRRNIDN